jgi:hypothetical protein
MHGWYGGSLCAYTHDFYKVPLVWTPMEKKNA